MDLCILVSFEDSVHLYRWADETVVREAKRMVSTNSSHIPKKRLIEMIDMGQSQGNTESTSVKVELPSVDSNDMYTENE